MRTEELIPFLTAPREDLSVEYKSWLDISETEHKATLAKAAIALANHGGGFVIIGMEEVGDAFSSVAKPDGSPEITQDLVNGAIQRFCDPEFHVAVYSVPHPTTEIVHQIISIPGDITVPVMCKRDCQGVIQKDRCYIRKPGPRSEAPSTSAEWRGLLDRCIRAGRDDLLDAFRTILTGRAEAGVATIDDASRLSDFSTDAYERWRELAETAPDESPARFPHGFYEFGFSLIGAEPLKSLADVQDALANARRIRHTGWSPFVDLGAPEWRPYPHEDFVEAWVGRDKPDHHSPRDHAHSDFWRVSKDGLLYMIRGYAEDDLERFKPGTALDATIPVWRVGEALLFTCRFAEKFNDVEEVGIRCRFTGLDGRSLVSVSGMRAFWGDDTCHSESMELEGSAPLAQINDNLVEVLHQLLTPLYEKFGFFRLPTELVQTELESMRGGRF